MTDQHVRDFLERMSTEEPLPFLDPEPLARRARRRAGRTVFVGALGVAAAIAVVFAGASQVREGSQRVPVGPPEEHHVDLGIFAPVGGRIVYENEAEVGDLGDNLGLWAIDPSGPADTEAGPSVAEDVASTLVRLDLEGATPLGWSSDGTELLFSRPDAASAESLFPMTDLYILHADGSETRLNRDPMMFGGATISPDGTRVVFAAWGDDLGLWIVDAEGGRPVRLPFPAAEGIVADPTFSPDGTQIAYVDSGESENHLWVMDADGGNPQEILASEPALAGGAGSLQWSPATDRIVAQGGLSDGTSVIYTFAPDGTDFQQVITGGLSPYWSPDGSQIAYTIECDVSDPSCGGLAIADADGSNVRQFGFGGGGPWHPGTLQRAEAPASLAPPTSPEPSTSTGSSTFTSRIHGIAIDHPSGWQTRPATEPWTGEPLDFDSPAADVIFHPTLGDRLYLAIASQPYGALSRDEWRDRALEWLCTGQGMAFGSWTVDGASADVMTCGSTASVALVFTEARGYVIRLVVAAASDEPNLAGVYDWDWHRRVLETVDLRPQEARDAPSPSASP